MADHANVTSVEALEAFRAVLINYLEKAGQALDEVGEEVSRTRVWLQQEQPAYWDGEIRRRRRVLEDAQQRLFSAELSSLKESSSAELREVRQARESLREAEATLDRIKKWSRGFDSQIEVPAKKVETLRSMITHETPKAIVFLTQAIRALDAYSGGTRFGSTAPKETPAPASGEAESPSDSQPTEETP